MISCVLIDVEFSTLHNGQVFFFFLRLSDEKENVTVVARVFGWCGRIVLCNQDQRKSEIESIFGE